MHAVLSLYSKLEPTTTSTFLKLYLKTLFSAGKLSFLRFSLISIQTMAPITIQGLLKLDILKSDSRNDKEKKNYVIQGPSVDTRATAGLLSRLVISGNLSRNLGSITSQKSCSLLRSPNNLSRSDNCSWKCSSSSSMNFAFATKK